MANHLAAQLTTADLVGEERRARLLHVRYVLARDEALGYHHFGNDRAAWRCYERGERALAEHPNPRSQYGDLARNRLLALAGIPRFTISEAEGLAHCAIPIFEQKADGLGLLLNRQALARAYVVQGGAKNFRRAERVLRDLLAELSTLPNAGQIHRVVVMQTLGQLYWRRGDTTEWQRVMAGLLPLARQAGLLYFTNRLKQTYGSALDSILEPIS